MLDSSQPSYSFHGSNSSHSKDNGSGGRTYHIPNYATSYANEKSNLISVSFDEDKASSNAIIRVVFIFLLFTAVPLSIIAWKPAFLNHVNSYAKPPDMVQRSLHAPVANPQDIYAQESTNPQPDTVSVVSDGAPVFHSVQAFSNVYWDEPQPHTRCLGFGKKEYTARLRNVPFYANWIQACERTQVTIHGVVILRPTFCESKWPFGGVVGHWVVDFGEDCLAYWGKISNKGCVGEKSKLRRFRAQLRGIKNEEDWLALCNTTPVNIHGISIPKPTVCENKGFWRGVYGTWDLEDGDC